MAFLGKRRVLSRYSLKRRDVSLQSNFIDEKQSSSSGVVKQERLHSFNKDLIKFEKTSRRISTYQFPLRLFLFYF